MTELYAPFEVIVPSSYCLTKITSTKSRGDIIPIAAEGVTVLQTEMSCDRMGKTGHTVWVLCSCEAGNTNMTTGQGIQITVNM